MKDVKFMKQRLLHNYDEDWSVIPREIQLSALEEEEDHHGVSVAHLMLKEKIKEEKQEEGNIQCNKLLKGFRPCYKGASVLQAKRSQVRSWPRLNIFYATKTVTT